MGGRHDRHAVETLGLRSRSRAQRKLNPFGRRLHPRASRALCRRRRPRHRRKVDELERRHAHQSLGLSPRHAARRRRRPNSAKWTSKYGSLVISAYEAGSADGMNEKGLVANLLYLADADFGKADGKPMLSIS